MSTTRCHPGQLVDLAGDGTRVIRSFAPVVFILVVVHSVDIALLGEDNFPTRSVVSSAFIFFGVVVYLMRLLRVLKSTLTALDMVIFLFSVGILAGGGTRRWPLILPLLLTGYLLQRVWVMAVVLVGTLGAVGVEWIAVEEKGGIGFVLVVCGLLSTLYMVDAVVRLSLRNFRETENSLDVTGTIIRSLEEYDIEEAECTVVTATDLPFPIRESCDKLINNLRTYRAHLPDSVLHQGKLSPVAVPSHPPEPGMKEEAMVCLVFTDIQSSTELWELFPQDMHEALRIHNMVLRQLATAHHGYEVKVIGDAFMFSFSSPQNAVRFGMDAQLELYRSRWPPPLSQHHLCAPHGEWNGLRVRLGMHWGLAKVDVNPITGRFDYLGETVHTASKVETSLKKGGLTGITESVLNELEPSFLQSPDVFVAKLPEVTNGVSTPLTIHVVLPSSLSGRMTGRGEPVPGAHFAAAPAPGLGGAASLLTIPQSPCGVSWPSQSPLSPRGSNAAFLSVGLDGVTGSCATVRGDFIKSVEESAEGRVVEMLLQVETAAARTQGTVTLVLSSLFMITWNTSRRCPDHVAQCGHFVGLLRSRKAHTGAVTGRMLAGSLAGARRCYVNVVGAWPELSMALAEAAALRSSPFLAAGEVGSHLGMLGQASRGERWREEHGRGEIVVWAAKGLAAGAWESVLEMCGGPFAVPEGEEEEETVRTYTPNFPFWYHRGSICIPRPSPSAPKASPELRPLSS
eukprot:Hpha_TRINITY_DN14272_c0_g1::TRINITY_DN14272_c0_g1_i1::g.22078::m.22078